MRLTLTVLGRQLLTIDTTPPPHDDGEPWWTMPHHMLTDLLQRAHHGEDPDVLVVELAANSD